MTEEKENSKEKKVSKTPKRLYRSSKNVVIAGVCAGLGDYFAIDPTFLRLLFIIITLAGGSGVLVYLILWIVLPSETTKKDISEETIKENVDEIREKAEEFASSGKSQSWWGVILLIAGLFFLFDNFGLFRVFRQYINFNLWDLWPLILIFFAFKMLGGEK